MNAYLYDAFSVPIDIYMANNPEIETQNIKVV